MPEKKAPMEQKIALKEHHLVVVVGKIRGVCHGNTVSVGPPRMPKEEIIADE